LAKTLIERREIPFAPPQENVYGLRIIMEKWDVDGTPKTYWKYGLPNVVQVIAFTTDRKIIAIKEFQPGVGTDYIHLIGETLDEGENPLEAAKRGLLEETGYIPDGEGTILSSILENSGRSERIIYLALLDGCSKTREGEKDIKVKLFKPVDFWNTMMRYFSANPMAAHGGGNTLKLMTLAFDRLGLLSPKNT